MSEWGCLRGMSICTSEAQDWGCGYLGDTSKQKRMGLREMNEMTWGQSRYHKSHVLQFPWGRGGFASGRDADQEMTEQTFSLPGSWGTSVPERWLVRKHRVLFLLSWPGSQGPSQSSSSFFSQVPSGHRYRRPITSLPWAWIKRPLGSLGSGESRPLQTTGRTLRSHVFNELHSDPLTNFASTRSQNIWLSVATSPWC